MTNQRGVIATGWLYLAGAIALLVVIGSVVRVWDVYSSKLDKRGYDRGISETEAKYAKRDNTQLQAALVAQKEAEKRAEAAETKAANLQVIAGTNYQKGVKDGQAKTDNLVAAAITGALRLRDPGGTACPSPNFRTGKTEIADTKPGSDGETGTHLSVQAATFLLGLTGEADTVAKQLTLAQAEITTILEVCAKR